MQHRATDRAFTQANRQPVNAGGQAGAVGFGSRFKIALTQRQRLGPGHPQPRKLNPEPGVDIVQLAPE